MTIDLSLQPPPAVNSTNLFIAPLLNAFCSSAGGNPSLLDLVGTWHWGPSTVTATVAGEHLVLGEPGSGRGARFRPVGTDEWLGLDSYYAGEPLRVVRRGDGSVSHLDLASFRFTRTPYDLQADVPGGVDERGWS